MSQIKSRNKHQRNIWINFHSFWKFLARMDIKRAGYYKNKFLYALKHVVFLARKES
jgi:hypothetical protein